MNSNRKTSIDNGNLSSANSKPIQIKLVLLGESAVGKSSLVIRYVNDEFHENKEPTIGAAFLTQVCSVEDKTVKFEIWDTAGQERFHSLAPMYYRNSHAAIVVYDITRASSLDRAKTWVKDLQRQAGTNIVIALVGNKLDLAESSDSSSPLFASQTSPGQASVENGTITSPEQVGAEPADETMIYYKRTGREVPKAEAEAYAREAGLLFFESSAKHSVNVQEIFTSIAKKLPLETILANSRTMRGSQLNSGMVNVSGLGEAGFSSGGGGRDQRDNQPGNNCAC